MALMCQPRARATPDTPSVSWVLEDSLPLPQPPYDCSTPATCLGHTWGSSRFRLQPVTLCSASSNFLPPSPTASSSSFLPERSHLLLLPTTTTNNSTALHRQSPYIRGNEAVGRPRGLSPHTPKPLHMEASLSAGEEGELEGNHDLASCFINKS